MHDAAVGEGAGLDAVRRHAVQKGDPAVEVRLALTEVRAGHLGILLPVAVLHGLEELQRRFNLSELAQRLDHVPAHLPFKALLVPNGPQEHVQMPQHLRQAVLPFRLEELRQQGEVNHSLFHRRDPRRHLAVACRHIIRSLIRALNRRLSTARDAAVCHGDGLQPSVVLFLKRELYLQTFGEILVAALQDDVADVKEILLFVIGSQESKPLIGIVILDGACSQLVEIGRGGAEVVAVVLGLRVQLAGGGHAAPAPPPRHRARHVGRHLGLSPGRARDETRFLNRAETPALLRYVLAMRRALAVRRMLEGRRRLCAVRP
mmetsp:Transcript_44307/g.73812  ORF Transcript_44307/g.73812 Transcript_44307/m.73812 type:complete len:318 (-) Transcript_44307:193-1146(-)